MVAHKELLLGLSCGFAFTAIAQMVLCYIRRINTLEGASKGPLLSGRRLNISAIVQGFGAFLQLFFYTLTQFEDPKPARTAVAEILSTLGFQIAFWGKMLVLLFRAQVVHPKADRYIEIVCCVLAFIFTTVDFVYTVKGNEKITCDATSCVPDWYSEESIINSVIVVMLFSLLSVRYIQPLLKVAHKASSAKRQQLAQNAAVLCVISTLSKLALFMSLFNDVSGQYGLISLSLDAGVQAVVTSEIVAPYRSSFWKVGVTAEEASSAGDTRISARSPKGSQLIDGAVASSDSSKINDSEISISES